jgi:dihydrofolate reductase
MRNLIYGINLTLDGCCDHTKGIADDELHEFWTDIVRGAGTLVYGRKTYELMVPFWPEMAKVHSGPTKALNDFAQAFATIDNIVVFSRTLDKAESKHTRVVSGNLKDEILKLKQQDGKDILLGGVDLPSQLIKLGLVDEYLFVIQPIVAGEGRRLMDDANLPEKLQLKLVESRPFKSGCVALRYLNK